MSPDFFLSQHARLLELVTPLPGSALVVERFHGHEAVSEPFRFVIDCVSTDAHFDLQALLGHEITLRLLQADGTRRHWHGHALEALQLGADGGLARYRLVMGPWLDFLGHGQDCYLFQDQDCLEILEQVFADYPVASWRHELTRPLRRHSRRTQYGESDLAFVRRILAEEGLSFRFEHDQTAVSGDDAEHARHQLIVFAADSELPTCPQALIRFHRSHATEASDAIQVWREARRIAPNAVRLAGWDYKRLLATGAEAITALSHGDLPALELFEGAPAYPFADAADAQAHADQRLAACESGYLRYSGEGSARQLHEACRFTLAQHDRYAGDAACFAVLAVEHHGANNLGAQAARLLNATDIEAGSYRNRFSAQPVAQAILPQPLPKPAARPQTALVVGLADAPLTTERDHRVKIQFPWQRGAEPNPGGTAPQGNGRRGNAPGNERSGTWVRVAEWLAGPDWGSIFLPRIGSEVVVHYIDGDIDRPLITGQLYNGEAPPPLSAGEASTANHPGTLAGWTSHNFADGFNQWLVDDATGQLRTRLATSALHAQLGLGHLITQPAQSNQRGAWRGSGFELRTDGWLAVRAGEGLLLSATARPEAASGQLDVAEAVSQLRAAGETAQALSDAARAQTARPLAANTALSALTDAIDARRDGRFEGSIGGQPARKARPGSREAGDATERFAAPIILAETPADIGLSSPASTLVFAGNALHATAQSDLQASAAHTLAITTGEEASLFTHSGGIRSIAAAGSHTIQAHTDALELLADQSVTVTSSHGEIRIHAKDRIVLQAGQSAVTLQGGDVTFACPGTFSVKGAGHAFEGPERGLNARARLPSGKAAPLPPPSAVQEIYSQTLETARLPEDWLPAPLDRHISAWHDGEPLGSLTRPVGHGYSSTLFTAKPMEIRFWLGGGQWQTEETVQLADDDTDCDSQVDALKISHDE